MSIQTNILPDNPQIEVIKSGETGLFTNYIYKAIPLAFDESMSYYETLCGLLHYLKNVIIPTVNNNANAVAELQSLYEQLRTYVNDYFTNLDVQEEINNKLDAMVEDGTLESILLNYTSIQKIYNTLQDLINDNNIVNNMKVKVLGYNEINDGGIAEYYITNVINDTKYQVELSNNLYATLLNNFGNTKVYGNDLNALQKALQYSDYVTMYDDLVIAPNTLTISGNKTIDFNNHKITMAETTLSYANLITISSGNVVIKNGKIDGNFNHHILSNVTNHTGILCNGGNILIENMEIYYCYYEGIILNGNCKVKVENCYLHHNGRNDIALLSWLYFNCNNSRFSDSIDNIDPLTNIDIEPYESNSTMGIAIINGCTFETTTKRHSVGTYLNANQSDSALITLTNNIFYNRVRLGYDQGLKSHYVLKNNKYINIAEKGALTLTETVGNVDVNDTFINCDNSILFNIYYTWGVIRNVNIKAHIINGNSNDIVINIPDGTLTYDYPYNNINMNINSNNIKNWHYLHNSKIKTPPLISDDNITLDFNHYYENIHMIGYGKTCNIDGIYNKSKILGLPITIYSDVNNIINSSLLPSIGNIGSTGLQVPQNGSSFNIKFHNYNYNKFIVDNITGNYNAKN